MTTRTAPTLFAFFAAAVVTLTMLLAVDGLATHEAAAAHLAQATAASARA